MEITLRIALLALLLSVNSFSHDCQKSLFRFKGDYMCFMPNLKSYVTKDCLEKKCLALLMLEKIKDINLDKIDFGDSRHKGAKICQALGGDSFVVQSEKNSDELCICVAKDHSAINCNTFNM